MLFNSYSFIFVYLPITLLVFFSIAKFKSIKFALGWLTFASFLFYSYWNPTYLVLLLISISFNYKIGKIINQAELKSQWAKMSMGLGIILNLCIIGYYKYANFLISTFNPELSQNLDLENIFLPLGISFYTFTQIAYLVDAYRGETKDSDYDLITYSLFVCFFPQLIAGPILRHDELIPQFKQQQTFHLSDENLARGLVLFGLGLAKKVLIADNLSPWVAPVFEHASDVTFIEAWVGALSYTFQLYFDFSGYSAMAIGLGWMFNINLPINFNSPYKAISITDFWRRWHITLSNFLRDYLYIPLGGSRKGNMRRYINLLLTMLLGGLWHGAGWTYVAWGGLHGFYLCINHRWRQSGIPLPKLLGWGITFFVVICGWVLFRASTFTDAREIIQTMLGFNGIVIPGEAEGKLAVLTQFGFELRSWRSLAYLPQFAQRKAMTFVVLMGLILGAVCLPNTQQMMEKFKPNSIWVIFMGLMTGICLICLNRVSEFIYFQF